MPRSSTCLAIGPGYPYSPVFPRTRKWVSNSTDLGAKVVDPAITSVQSVLKSASLSLFPASETIPVLSPEPAAAPLSSPLAPPIPSPRMAVANFFTSNQKRQMRRKILWAPAPDSAPVLAPALSPLQCQLQPFIALQCRLQPLSRNERWL